MSSVDNRIVKMSMENAQFKTAASETMSTLQKLSSSLKFTDGTKGLENISNKFRTMDLGFLANGIETVTSKFSALEFIGITALANITNSALSAGANFVSALTLDPVMSGFNEYETKMNSITTIMTNTASKGTTMADVTATLEELNTYADKTIYNFGEMTKNIGTFTAAGIDLNTSATAIKGIANLAAGSGSSSEQASSAMYQLSQALAAGKVGLQDWNSVVNAGMGGELFQKALEKTAASMGKGRDMSVSFRDSLQDGWITADVLTSTLEQFAADESLLQAATQVKTFTQLLDTMKESVQSGWSQTWETIIGNKDEAAVIFTGISNAFNGIMGPIADARNEALSFWKANGGRDAIIAGLVNVFKLLGSILKPIGEAFRTFFPATTGKNLLDFSNKFKELTEKFKMSESTIDRIKRSFSGVFALLHIGVTLFKAVASGVGNLISAIFPMSGGLLKVTASIGDFIVGLDKMIQSSNVFKTAVSYAVTAITKTLDFLKSGFEYVIKTFEKFGVIDTSSISTFSEKVSNGFSPLTKLGDILSKIFGFLVDVMKEFISDVGKVLGKIIEVGKKLCSGIYEALGGDNTKIMSLVNGGVLGLILLKIYKFVKQLASSGSEVGGFAERIANVLDGLRNSLEPLQNSLKANTLLKIAAAIGILALSILLMSTIDPVKLGTSMAAMTGMFVQLFGSMAIFEKIVGSSGFNSMGKITGAMVTLSIAILLLTIALEKMSKLKWEEIGKGMTGIAGGTAILIAASKLISKESSGLISASISLVIFAGALIVMTKAIECMGNLSWTEIGVGIAGLAATMALLAIGLRLLPKNMAIQAVGLALLGGALLVISAAIGSMGNKSWETIGKGLGALAGTLAILAIAMKAMSGGLKGAAAMKVMSKALVVLIPALITLALLPIKTLMTGLLGLAAAFLVIGVAGALLSPITPAILALSIAFGIFSLSVLAISAAVSLFVGSLIALIGVSASLGAVIPAFMLALGTGLIALMVLIAANTPKIVAAFVTIFTGIIAAIGMLIPLVIQTLVGFITNFIDTLADAIPQIIESATNLVIAILTGISNNIYKITSIAIDIVVRFISGITSKIGLVIDAAFKFIIAFINGLSSAINKNAPALQKAVVNLIKSMITALMGTLSSFKDVGGYIIDGLKNGILGGIDAIKDAAKSVAKAALTSAKKFLGIKSPSREFMAVGRWSDEGLAKGLNKHSGLVENAAIGVADGALSGVQKAMSCIGDFINSDIDSQPVITPVLDLTEIQNGSSKINSIMGDGCSIKTSVDAARTVSSNINANSNGSVGNNQTTNNQTTNNSNVTNHFTINGSNANDIANEVSRILQKQVERRNVVWE